jgi:hypothetical protein
MTQLSARLAITSKHRRGISCENPTMSEEQKSLQKGEESGQEGQSISGMN